MAFTLKRTVHHNWNDKGDQSVINVNTSTGNTSREIPDTIVLTSNGEGLISLMSRHQMEDLICSLRAVADEIWE